MRKTHSGTNRPRGQKVRQRGKETAGWHSTRYPTQAQVTRVTVALRKVEVGVVGSTNSQNKSKRSKKGIADKVSYRLCRKPVHLATGSEQSYLDMAESFAPIWSCKKYLSNLGWKSTLDPTTDRMSAGGRTRHDAPKCRPIKETD